MVKLLTSSFRMVMLNLKSLSLVYGLLLLLGLVVAVPFFNIWLKMADHSLELRQLVPDFDYTTFSDFLRYSKKAFEPLLLVVLANGLFFVLLLVLFTGGFMYLFHHSGTKAGLGDFLRASLGLFPKYLALLMIEFCYFLFAFAIFVLLLLVCTGMAEGGIETDYVWWSIPPLLFLFLSFSLITVGSDYGKVLIYHYPKCPPLRAFHLAAGYVLKNLKTVYLFWIILLSLLMVLMIYLLFEHPGGIRSASSLLSTLFIQQMFIFFRLFTKVWRLACASAYLQISPFPAREPDKNTDLQT